MKVRLHGDTDLTLEAFHEPGIDIDVDEHVHAHYSALQMFHVSLGLCTASVLIGYAKQVGFDTLLERGRHAADGLPNELVYAGISLGVMPAQLLAQTRRGARGALLLSAAIPAAEFGDGWPRGVPLQIHMMEDDPWVEEDLPAARELVEGADRAELFLYPGDRHLFADSSLPDYDEAAARSELSPATGSTSGSGGAPARSRGESSW